MEISEGQEDGIKTCFQYGKWNKAEKLTLGWP
jgi:hypothetical protein